MIATSGFLTALECTKFVFGRGAHDAPPDPLVGWGGGYPLPILHPLDAFGVSLSSPTATRPRAFGARSSTPPAVVIPAPPILGRLDKTLRVLQLKLYCPSLSHTTRFPPLAISLLHFVPIKSGPLEHPS